MLRKYLYISVLLLLAAYTAVAQSGLHDEVLTQTDTIALYRRNCQKILHQRIAKGMFDELLEVVDFYNSFARTYLASRLDSADAADIEKFYHPQLVSTNALLGVCLLNGDYDRFFATLPDFPMYSYQADSENTWGLENAVKWSIAADAERWNNWLNSYPMTDEQRTLASIYLMRAGLNVPQTTIEKDKAYRLCVQSLRKPEYEPYQAFLRKSGADFEYTTFNITLGYQIAWYNERLYKYLNSNYLIYASFGGKSSHTYVGVSLNHAVGSKYRGDTTTFATYDDHFSIVDGEQTNYLLVLFELAHRLGQPRRVTFYGEVELGGDYLGITQRYRENDRTVSINHTIKPPYFVGGLALKSEIRLAEWKADKLLFPDMGLSLNISVGGRMMRTDYMLWASAGLTFFIY